MLQEFAFFDAGSGLQSSFESIGIELWVSFSLKFLFVVFFYHTFFSLADSMRVIHSIEASVGSAERLSSTAY
jgi:hypothetical protein